MVSAETYLRLRFLNDKSVERFRGVLSEAEIACLLNRRDGILAYLDRLVEERGYSNVVV